MPSITSIARIAGVHRDTLYALINGERVNQRSQYAICKAIQEIGIQAAGQTKTRVMSVNLTGSGPKLTFGINKLNIFR